MKISPPPIAELHRMVADCQQRAYDPTHYDAMLVLTACRVFGGDGAGIARYTGIPLRRVAGFLFHLRENQLLTDRGLLIDPYSRANLPGVPEQFSGKSALWRYAAVATGLCSYDPHRHCIVSQPNDVNRSDRMEDFIAAEIIKDVVLNDISEQLDREWEEDALQRIRSRGLFPDAGGPE